MRNTPNGREWFVHAQNGDDAAAGENWSNALRSIAETFKRLRRGDVIHLYGELAEEGLVSPKGVTDIRIFGYAPALRGGSIGFPDGPKSGASNWTRISNDSPLPLLQITQQGWCIENVMFMGSKFAPAVLLTRTLLGESSEDGFAGDYAGFKNCGFQLGFGGIGHQGGVNSVHVNGCFFSLIENAIIELPGEGVGYALFWEIKNSKFIGNKVNVKAHSLADSLIVNNHFQDRDANRIHRADSFIDLGDTHQTNRVSGNWFECIREDADKFLLGSALWGFNDYIDGTMLGFVLDEPAPEPKPKPIPEPMPEPEPDPPSEPYIGWHPLPDGYFGPRGQNETELVSLVPDPPKHRLGLPVTLVESNLGGVSYNTIRPDGTHDEHVLVGGRLTADKQGGAYTVAVRPRGQESAKEMLYIDEGVAILRTPLHSVGLAPGRVYTPGLRYFLNVQDDMNLVLVEVKEDGSEVPVLIYKGEPV